MKISDKEKIEIMQHFIDGGEIEGKFTVNAPWRVFVKPSWDWRNCFFRKRVYNYPLYFEYTDIDDPRSEKFIVEFAGLTEGIVVQKTYSNWELGHEDDEWIPHTDKNLWREVPNPFKKKLEQLEILKEKFTTGDYICVWQYSDSGIVISDNPIWGTDGDYILIHKRHEDVLKVYLKDRNIEIECNPTGFGFISIKCDFLVSYDEDLDYRIKKPETQIVYECYRIEKKTGECNILGTLYTDSDLYKTRLQYEKHYTYHKTGRSFEIKLGDN
jgi:hypothetical protein